MPVKQALARKLARHIPLAAPVLALVLVFAPEGCSGADGAPKYEGATIRNDLHGNVECTPSPEEHVRYQSVVRDLGLAEGEAVRLCVLASSVRHAQWMERNVDDAAMRSRIRAAVRADVDRFVAISFRPESVAGVRAYLLGE